MRAVLQERAMAMSQGVDEYDDSWLNEPLCIRVLCEHDKVSVKVIVKVTYCP